jgi:hypothetical protein
MKPTVFEGFCSGLGVLKITFKNARTLDQYLPVGSNLHFHPWQGLPDPTDLKVAFATDRCDACALCLAVSFNQWKANGIKELQHVR